MLAYNFEKIKNFIWCFLEAVFTVYKFRKKEQDSTVAVKNIFNCFLVCLAAPCLFSQQQVEMGSECSHLQTDFFQVLCPREEECK